jgi:hypothetical protein
LQNSASDPHIGSKNNNNFANGDGSWLRINYHLQGRSSLARSGLKEWNPFFDFMINSFYWSRLATYCKAPFKDEGYLCKVSFTKADCLSYQTAT